MSEAVRTATSEMRELRPWRIVSHHPGLALCDFPRNLPFSVYLFLLALPAPQSRPHHRSVVPLSFCGSFSDGVRLGLRHQCRCQLSQSFPSSNLQVPIRQPVVWQIYRGLKVCSRLSDSIGLAELESLSSS